MSVHGPRFSPSRSGADQPGDPPRYARRAARRKFRDERYFLLVGMLVSLGVFVLRLSFPDASWEARDLGILAIFPGGILALSVGGAVLIDRLLGRPASLRRAFAWQALLAGPWLGLWSSTLLLDWNVERKITTTRSAGDALSRRLELYRGAWGEYPDALDVVAGVQDAPPLPLEYLRGEDGYTLRFQDPRDFPSDTPEYVLDARTGQWSVGSD